MPDDLHPITKSSVSGLAGTGLIGVSKDNLYRNGLVAGIAVGFIEIELDTETGKFEILDYLGVSDCGTVLHPKGLSTQISGGAVQGFGLAAFTSSVEGLPVTALDDGFLELTTLASLIVGLLSVFSVLLGGGFLELTDFVVFSVLLSFALSESFSVSDFSSAFSADFLVAMPSDMAFFRTLSACASTRLEL